MFLTNVQFSLLISWCNQTLDGWFYNICGFYTQCTAVYDLTQSVWPIFGLLTQIQFCQKSRVLGVKYFNHTRCLCKWNDKYEVCHTSYLSQAPQAVPVEKNSAMWRNFRWNAEIDPFKRGENLSHGEISPHEKCGDKSVICFTITK